MAEIVWTEPALQSLDEVADFIALDNPQAAQGLVCKVFQQVDLLSHAPEMGNIPAELKGTPYRRLVISPIYLYYRVEGSRIIIIFVERTEREFDLLRLTLP